MAAAHDSLPSESGALLSKPKQVLVRPSMMEAGARLFVTRFLQTYVSSGCLTLLEEDGTTFYFQGERRNCSLKIVLKVHSPQFYWKVMTRADLGLADAYIDGDISFTDKNEGLLNLFMILIDSRESNSSVSRSKSRRGWWTPLLFTAGIASAKYFFKHLLRQNTLTQGRRNISRHYDLSNELFALFLDETMTYSSAVFKKEDEDLKVAQLRKISILIEKARIDKKRRVLDIGCGWGSFAIEVVKQTWCKYTGITLSEAQLKYAEKKVKNAGLQDHIRLLLCDYRQVPDTYKYDRIISCEMIEHVGHEFMEEFFGCCESLLSEDGILVLQFSSMPDERYDEHKKSSDFIKEYIFPGACIPSLSRITSAMASASRLSVEHLENIGNHYYQTLQCWRKKLMENQSKIVALGFDEKFIRTWEYYFEYCAAGFKSRTLGDYQIVFTRPGNVAAFSNSYQSVPSGVDSVPDGDTEPSY
ncbi:cyclopropane mycolic acid synthase 1-like isoform X5 [Juglans microcarpa x Juglans regia]|uniref:cyclopropane mycolic acid synthase 1-like isoform X5 n=1 Tax=Juglans microcarpa x Juglans regia TaxID=2249226 RepID=UPI001B7DA8AE|nr:cyclopropane mycolic acid synthase 1-like isoform X5 [Juglans microcarpa x Juglans regia]